MKEVFIEATEILKINQIMSAIKELQLSRPTVTRRVEVMSQDRADKL